jgi:hypothetical protein
VRIAGVGLLTGWGEGTRALPDNARRAAGDRRVIPLAPPALGGDRFRRATRECVLAVAAVETLLATGDATREDIRGSATGLVYVTTAAYGAANRAFIEAVAGANTLHFPYTAPSAVPAEVAIEFGLTGSYTVFVGGADAAISALWQASTLLRRGLCHRVLVLAVETFAECEALYARGRWLLTPPLVPGADIPIYGESLGATALDDDARTRAGETLACGPLIALALARDSGLDCRPVTGAWRGRREGLRWVERSAAS